MLDIVEFEAEAAGERWRVKAVVIGEGYPADVAFVGASRSGQQFETRWSELAGTAPAPMLGTAVTADGGRRAFLEHNWISSCVSSPFNHPTRSA